MMIFLAKRTIRQRLLICAFFTLPTLAFSAVGEFNNEQATCYVFKNNKIAKKDTCLLSGSSGASNAPYRVFEATFNMKGDGNFKVVNNAFGDGITDDGKWINQQQTIKLQNQQAVMYRRDSKTYKVLSTKQYNQRFEKYLNLGNHKKWKNMPQQSWIECFKNVSGTEFCYSTQANIF